MFFFFKGSELSLEKGGDLYKLEIKVGLVRIYVFLSVKIEVNMGCRGGR